MAFEEIQLRQGDALRLLQTSPLKALRQLTGATIDVSVTPGVLRLAGNKGMLDSIKKLDLVQHFSSFCLR